MPEIKFVYARALGASDRFGTYAQAMQSDAWAIHQNLLAASQNKLAPRYDTGSSCGDAYLDIARVQLPNTAPYYQAAGELNSFEMIVSEVERALSSTTRRRLFVVYTDAAPTSAYSFGRARIYGDDRSDKSVNQNNLYTHTAVVYPATINGTLPITGDDASKRQLVTEHEILHLLGAVQNSAPNTTGAWHCRDGLDVMCYNDGGPTSTQYSRCSDPKIIDCGGDDYFNIAPAPGSYLATKWNVAKSPWLINTAGDPASIISVLSTSLPARVSPYRTFNYGVTFASHVDPPSVNEIVRRQATAGASFSYYNHSDTSGLTRSSSMALPRGIYQFTWTAKLIGGETVSTAKTVAVNNLPSVNVSFAAPKLAYGAPAVMNLSRSDPDGDAMSTTVNWGDGRTTTTTGNTASVIYDSPGVKTATVTVSDGLESVQKQASVRVNTPPVAAFTVPPALTLNTPSSSAVTGQHSFDVDGDPLTYHWSFGDGRVSTEPQPVVSYAAPGTYVLSLTVSDGLNSATTSRAIRVNRAPSVTTSGLPQTMNAGDSIALNMTYSDPDGDPITPRWTIHGAQEGTDYVIVSGSRSSQSIGLQWKEDTQAASVNVTAEAHDGMYTSTASVSTLINRKPTARVNMSAPYGMTTGQPVLLDASSSSDPDGDPLAFYWHVSGVQGVDYVVDFSSGPSQQIRWLTGGVKNVSVRVVDSRGLTHETSAGMYVNAAPQVQIWPAQYSLLPVGASGAYQAAAQDPGGVIVGYFWSLADPSSATLLSSPNDPMLRLTWRKRGSQIISLTVIDNDGAAATTSYVQQVV